METKTYDVSPELKTKVLDYIFHYGPIRGYDLSIFFNLSTQYIYRIVQAIRLEIGDETIVNTPDGYKVPTNVNEVDWHWRTRMSDAASRLKTTHSVVKVASLSFASKNLELSSLHILQAQELIAAQINN